MGQINKKVFYINYFKSFISCKVTLQKLWKSLFTPTREKQYNYRLHPDLEIAILTGATIYWGTDDKPRYTIIYSELKMRAYVCSKFSNSKPVWSFDIIKM